MNENQNSKMRWILFWVFLGFYAIFTILTIFALFCNFGQLAESYKSILVTTFIIETGVGVITLFYSLFGLNKSSKHNTPEIETDSKRNIEIVTDSPLGKEISLNQSVDLLTSFDENLRIIVTNIKFCERFKPCMLVLASNDEEYEFRPNIVFQVEKNPLVELNITLADYMESGYSIIKDTQEIIGQRHVRSGSLIATQWYRVKMTNFLGLKVDSDVTYVQFQKIVVSDDLMGIITLSYSDETKPEDINLMQKILDEFGIKK